MLLDVLVLRSFFEIFRVNCTLRNVALPINLLFFRWRAVEIFLIIGLPEINHSRCNISLSCRNFPFYLYTVYFIRV